jgi:isopropylmalate/homocitrate/citramalate synthase
MKAAVRGGAAWLDATLAGLGVATGIDPANAIEAGWLARGVQRRNARADPAAPAHK